MAIAKNFRPKRDKVFLFQYPNQTLSFFRAEKFQSRKRMAPHVTTTGLDLDHDFKNIRILIDDHGDKLSSKKWSKNKWLCFPDVKTKTCVKEVLPNASR